MMRTRNLVAIVACVALALGACGSDGSDDDADATDTTADSGVSGTEVTADDEGSTADGDDEEATDDGADDDGADDDGSDGSDGDDGAGGGASGSGGGRDTSAGIDPCAALDAGTVGEAFGFELPDTQEATGERSVQDVEWTTIVCRWSSEEHEVSAAVAGPDEFADGFTCAEPIAVIEDPVVVDGLGDQAWWTWDDFQGGKGDLAVCAGELRIDISVRGPRTGEPIAEEPSREGAITVGEALLP